MVGDGGHEPLPSYLKSGSSSGHAYICLLAQAFDFKNSSSEVKIRHLQYALIHYNGELKIEGPGIMPSIFRILHKLVALPRSLAVCKVLELGNILPQLAVPFGPSLTQDLKPCSSFYQDKIDLLP